MNSGLIIINLGSPDSYQVKDVRKYLKEFLMDERVIDYPYIFRKLLVEGIIVPFRAKKSAHAYSTVWTDKGSPLKVISEDFTRAVATQINMPVELAMRYGNPTPTVAVNQLLQKAGKLDEVLIAPMYPHYAMSSYETALEHVKAAIKNALPQTRIKVLKPFYNQPQYIAALAGSIKPFIEKGNFDTVLFSYHGLPISHLKKSDPTGRHCYMRGNCCSVPSEAWGHCYKHQVYDTTNKVKQLLGLPDEVVKVSFQSRLGSEKWVQPYTDYLLQDLPKQGRKKMLVICPAFVADCLETLEEIMVRGKELFMENGGEEFVYAPCLNTNSDWVETFSAYCNQHNGTFKNLWG